MAYAGHSLGAVTAFRAAFKTPELFSKIIAIDPAILPHRLARFYPLVKHMRLLAKRNRLYAGALKRRKDWADRAEALAYFTGRKALATWPEQAVEGYVDSALVPGAAGLTLSCDRIWESRTFKHVPAEIGFRLKHLQVPTLLIRASRGSIYPDHLTLSAQITERRMEGSHFVHLETPDLVAEEIHAFLV